MQGEVQPLFHLHEGRKRLRGGSQGIAVYVMPPVKTITGRRGVSLKRAPSRMKNIHATDRKIGVKHLQVNIPIKRGLCMAHQGEFSGIFSTIYCRMNFKPV